MNQYPQEPYEEFESLLERQLLDAAAQESQSGDGFENLVDHVRFWCFCAFWAALILLVGGVGGALILLRIGH